MAAAKVAVEFAKKNDKLTIVGGALGEGCWTPDGVKALAKLPSLDELRGKLVGLMQAPATKIAGVLQAPAGQLARVLAPMPQAAEKRRREAVSRENKQFKPRRFKKWLIWKRLPTSCPT